MLFLGLVACAPGTVEPVAPADASSLSSARSALVKEATGGAQLLEGEGRPLGMLAFLAGSWAGVDAGGNPVDEHWTQARGGMLLGVSRLTMDGQVTMFEYMRLEVREDHGIVLVVQRRGASPMIYDWVSGGRGFAVFSLDRLSVTEAGRVWPSRILYGRAGDRLHVRFEDGEDGVAEELVLHPALVRRGY